MNAIGSMVQYRPLLLLLLYLVGSCEIMYAEITNPDGEHIYSGGNKSPLTRYYEQEKIEPNGDHIQPHKKKVSKLSSDDAEITNPDGEHIYSGGNKSPLTRYYEQERKKPACCTRKCLQQVLGILKEQLQIIKRYYKYKTCI